MIHTSNVRINTVKAVIASALAVSPTVKLLISFNVSNIRITTQVQTIIFAKVIRKVPEDEKGAFYKKSGLVCGIVAAAWFVICIVMHPGVDGFFNYMIEQYRTPGLVKVVGTFCSIILVFAVAFFLMPIIEKWKFVYNKLCYYSRQISKMYAVHIGVYWTIAGFAAFYEFSVRDCLILSVVVLIVTDLLVQGYIIIDNKIKEQK